jgi:hypothetical protein
MSDAEDFAAPKTSQEAYPTGGLGLFEDNPFAGSAIEPTDEEIVIGMLIARKHRGRANAVSLAWIMRLTGKDERHARGLIEQLRVTHGLRIGATEAGYFWIETPEDLAAAIARPKAQIFAMWRTLRVLLNKEALAEMHGQLRLEE